jgi:c(7)-type cytochrome triheme protein
MILDKRRLFEFLHFSLLGASLSFAMAEPQPADAQITKDSAAATTSAPSSQLALPNQSRPAATRSTPNSFNRLLKIAPRHMPPAEDGIHDPANDYTKLLQAPQEAYAALPKTEGDLGNGVNWVLAMDEGQIKPIWDINNPDAKPTVLVMDIIRIPKGSMPNELFPHRQHTLWLDCSNCHPDIFIAKKGANQISMAANLLGQKCGVCHGKVAYPFSQCKRCHSQPKMETGKAGAQP